ncbi:MAG: class I SAM-dependent methyltransferase [Ilumatobacteraceae bacterium]|nr:class I SAM-dependent methyltransferase [Ilumatobacteraceae bacterium]
MTEQRPLDPDALKMFSFSIFSKLEGAVTAGMIHLGDRLGLYEVMASSVDGDTSDSLASKAGLHERWVREWLHNQVAARIVTCADLSDNQPIFHLSPEGVAVLASPNHPAYGMGMFHRLPQTMGALESMPEAFRTGLGHDYDSHGPEGAVGIERSFEPWNQSFLIPMVIPALDGMKEKLSSGVRVADIGCGSGGAALLMGSTFPNSIIDGFDISRFALERAEERKSESGAHNVSFFDPREHPIADDHSYDLICTFDCIHDMTQPTEMMKTIRKALKNDGTWLLVDIKAQETLELNVTKNPMASLLYGISVLSCMSSAMSEDGGEGLGTLGLSASRAESMARQAGFTQFKKLDVEHSVNAFYEVRP